MSCTYINISALGSCMGNFLSKQVDALQEPLREPLLRPIETVVLYPGDLLLVCSNELELCLVSELWVHVALVVGNPRLGKAYAYHSGVFEDLQHYVARHQQIETRPLVCHRSDSFGVDLYTTAVTSAGEFLAETELSEEDREGYAVADVLHKMGVVDVLRLSGIRPTDFSAQASLIEHYGQQRPLGKHNTYVHHMPTGL